MDELKVGDIVTLKGYAQPKMVIEHIAQKTEGKVANCKWISEGKFFNQQCISIHCLDKVK